MKQHVRPAILNLKWNSRFYRVLSSQSRSGATCKSCVFFFFNFANTQSRKGGRTSRKLFSLLAGKCVRRNLPDRTAVSFYLVTFKCIVLRFHLAFDDFSVQRRPFVCLLQPPRVMTDTARTVVRVRIYRERPIAGQCILPDKLSSIEDEAFLFSRDGVQFGT